MKSLTRVRLPLVHWLMLSPVPQYKCGAEVPPGLLAAVAANTAAGHLGPGCCCRPVAGVAAGGRPSPASCLSLSVSGGWRLRHDLSPYSPHGSHLVLRHSRVSGGATSRTWCSCTEVYSGLVVMPGTRTLWGPKRGTLSLRA